MIEAHIVDETDVFASPAKTEAGVSEPRNTGDEVIGIPLFYRNSQES